jgi:streptogramin lyase
LTDRPRILGIVPLVGLLAALTLPGPVSGSSLTTVVGGGGGDALRGAKPTEIKVWTHSVRVDTEGRLHLTMYDSFDDSVEKEGFIRIGADGRVDRVLRHFECCVDDLWVDPRGMVYLTSGPSVIRVAPDDSATVVAGSDQRFYIEDFQADPAVPGDGGPAARARFASGPQGIVGDRDGNLYLSDYAAGVIRRIDARTGTITRVAGRYFESGYAGDGGPAVDALLYQPHKLAIDREGRLLVCDRGNACVRRIDPVTGIISTLAGKPGDPLLGAPMGIDVDRWGNVYVATTNSRVVRIAPDGAAATVAGGEWGLRDDAADATRGWMFATTGVAVDRDGHLFVADYQREGWSTVKRVEFDPQISGIGRPPDGAAGRVAIDGRYFNTDRGTGAVLLDGRPLTIVSWSNTAIVAELPAGQSGRTLEVATPGGKARRTLD